MEVAVVIMEVADVIMEVTDVVMEVAFVIIEVDAIVMKMAGHHKFFGVMHIAELDSVICITLLSQTQRFA